MPKKVKVFAAGLFLAIIGVVCVAMVATRAHAESSSYGNYEAKSGEGWSMTSDGVFTIENDEGWVDCLKNGYKVKVEKLVIGKDVTNFRMYEVSIEAPTPDFYDPSEIAGYDKFGKPYYEYAGGSSLYPRKIEVEAENPIFSVADGLLINTKTSELVLSEVGVTDAVIPEGVRAITRKAFAERQLQTVQFPSSLMTIGEGAFVGCVELKKLVFPESLTTLKISSFSGCTSLQEVSLPAGLQVLDAYSFNRCPIQYIEIPKHVEEIGSYAFMECDQLQQVLLPDGLKRIGNSAFSNCSQLYQIDLPEGLENIGGHAFSGCYSLKRVILPDSLQQIGEKAFWRCDLSVLRFPAELAIPVFDDKDWEYKVNPNVKKSKSFDLSSVNTVILSGSDYDFGYPAISNAKNVYFLGLPPEDVGRILDEETVKSIYCSDEFEFEWTRSTVTSWVRQKLKTKPTYEMNEWVNSLLRATPKPTAFVPTPTPTPTPWPTPMPRPSVSPAATAEPEKQAVDPILFVFAGVIALVVAGIAVLAIKPWAIKKKTRRKRRKIPQLPSGETNATQTQEGSYTDDIK